MFGSSILALGDVDGDGSADFAVGAMVGWGGIWVFSGRSGQLLYEVEGSVERSLGDAFCLLGDLDTDGVQDFVSTAYQSLRSQTQGLLSVFSGRTGDELYSLSLEQHGLYDFQVRSVTRSEDLDGDGISDLIVSVSRKEGAPPGSPVPAAVILSSSSGHVLREVHADLDPHRADVGRSTSGVGDAEHAGVILGAGNYAERFDFLGVSRAGTVLWRRTYESRHVMAKVRVGDVDRDGNPEFLVSHKPRESKAGRFLYGAGRRVGVVVQLLSGWNGEVLREHTNKQDDSQRSSYGESLASAGDLDGDGIDDYLIANPSGFPAGVAWVHSGATGRILWTWVGKYELGDFGQAVAGIGDVNGDGTPDVAIGMCTSHFPEPGKVDVYCGSTGVRLYRIDSADL